MQIKDWVEMMSRRGDVCTPYMRRLGAVETREDMFRVLCDANGGAWLFGFHAKHLLQVPVREFMEEFHAYINGGHVMVYPKGYASKFYCRYSGEVVADTTLVYLLECPEVQITVPANEYPSIVLSSRSHATIAMMPGSRLNVELYGDADANISGDMTRVRITNH